MALTLKRDAVMDTLKNTNGRIFSVEFIKRTTGEHRKMLATLNYESKLKGGTLNYSPDAKNLLVVWDIQKKGFRSISLDSVLRITAGGNTYEVTA